VSQIAAARASGRAFAPIPAMAPASLFEVRRKPVEVGSPGAAPQAAFASSLASLPAMPARPAVQRRCAACEAEEKKIRRQVEPEDEEELATAIQPSLEVGPVGDHYEREADSIAARVTAMPGGGAVAASGAKETVQRACAACEDEVVRRRDASGEEDEEVRARPADAGLGTSIRASASQLTGGGRPLPDETRGYFESRMGRDLSAVRVHEGSEAGALNRSIRARAFTYSNHVWLGPGERAAPGFTMAHELSHVLQQTQPGPVMARPEEAARAARAPQRVMRSEIGAFWVQEGVQEDNALVYNTRIHDAAIGYLREDNDLISEAPIPGAKIEGVACGYYGFADLFKADRTVGLEQKCDVSSPGALPVMDFGFGVGRMIDKKHTPHKGNDAKEYAHDHNRAPKITSDGTAITGIARAPKRIRIGDMKPGHNKGSRSKGIQQIRNYVDGITAVRNAVNSAPDSMKSGASKNWSLDIDTMTTRTKMTIRDTVHPKKLKGRKNKLRMHYRGEPIEALKPEKPIYGQMVIAKDRKNQGVYVYVWVPTTDFTALENQPKLVALGNRLETEVIKPLGVSPMSKRVSPLSAGARPASARPGPRQIRRRKSTQPVAPNFNHKLWSAKRDEIAKLWPRNALTTPTSKGFSKQAREDLVTKIGASEAADLYNEHFADPDDDRPLDLKEPAETAGSLAAAKTIKKLEFWLSFKGRAMGMLRRLFGKVFVTGHNAFLKLKNLFAGNKKIKPAGTALTLTKAALSALLTVLLIVGGAIVRRTSEIVAGAVASCTEERLQSMFGGDIDRVEEEVSKLEVGGVTIEQLSQMEEKQLTAHFVGNELADIIIDLKDGTFAEKIFGPFEKEIDKIATAFDTLSKAATVIDIIQWAIRVVACLSPPAIGCLWLIAESALSWAFSMFVRSCWFMKKIFPHVAKHPTVQSISSTLADAVLGKAEELIPASILGGCSLKKAKSEAAAEQPDFSDLDKACDRSGRQPTAEELELAKMLENVPAAKLALLKELAEAQGWKPGAEIDLTKAQALIEYLQKTDIDQLQTDMQNAKTKSPKTPSELADADKAGKEGSTEESRETVEEGAKRKAGGGAAGGAGEEKESEGSGEGAGGAEKEKEAGAGTGGQVIVTRPKGVPKDWKPSSESKYEIVIRSGLPSASGFKAGKIHPVNARLTIAGAIVEMTGLRLVVYERNETRDEGGGLQITYLVSPTEDVYITELDYTLSGGETSAFQYVETRE